MKPEFRDVRRAMYALKRQHPQQVLLRRTVSDSVDVSTGRKGSTLVTVTIRRAVVTSAKSVREFAYDLGYILAAKNFTQGAHYDHKTRLFIVDQRDIPTSFPVDMNMHLIFAGKRYEVKDLQEVEEAEVLLITGDNLEGGLPLNQTNVQQTQGLNLRDSGSAA